LTKGVPAGAEYVAGQIGTSVEHLAEGVWAIVNANIAQAIREITVQQGTDTRELALVAFRGAGPQHAVGVAASWASSE
jgi:N-methylhydantoinase A